MSTAAQRFPSKSCPELDSHLVLMLVTISDKARGDTTLYLLKIHSSNKVTMQVSLAAEQQNEKTVYLWPEDGPSEPKQENRQNT